MKKLYTITALLMAALMIFAGCSSKSLDYVTEDQFSYFADADMEMAETEATRDYGGFDGNTGKGSYNVSNSYSAEEPKEKAQSDSKTVAAGTSVTRKIIYTSSFDIKTEEFDTAISALNELCEKYGAYFESSETYGTKENANRHGSYRVRVPVQNYNAFKNSAGDIGVIFRSSENNEDVTEKYFDTEARLASAKIREERLLAILATADSLDNVLLLEAELAEVRYEIESMSGTLRKYDSLVSYSTISINIQEVIEPVQVKVAPRTFGQRMGTALTDGFEDFTDFLEDFAVVISYNLPGIIIFIIIVVVVVFTIKSKVNKNRKSKVKTETTAEEKQEK